MRSLLAPLPTLIPVALLGALLVALALPACAPAPRMATPTTVERLPERFADAPFDTTDVSLAWWTSFRDPVLDRLVDSALVRNLDLRAAVARVSELQNQYRIARAGLYPSVQATVDGSTSSVPANVGATGSISERIPDFPDRFDITQYSASLGMAYELDFWGRVRSANRAALHTYLASGADLLTLRIGVVSETVATYFELLDLERRLALTALNIDLLAERAELSEDRYRRGLLSSFELYAIRQEYEAARTALPQLEALRADAVGRLGVVLGAYPAETRTLLAAFDTATVVLDPIPAGLPSDLLLRRPDLIAAEQRLEAARQQIGVARAEQFPRIALTGAGGTQSSDLENLVDTGQHFFQLAGSVTQVLFNGGALRANKRAAYDRYAQAASAYEKAVLTAFQEVETALAAFASERERYSALREELAYARASLDNQEMRYRRGVGDYLAYLDARRNLIRVESTLATAARALAGARLAVHRALGGAWVPDPEALFDS